jgi:hypothetical protein
VGYYPYSKCFPADTVEPGTLAFPPPFPIGFEVNSGQVLSPNKLVSQNRSLPARSGRLTRFEQDFTKTIIQGILHIII